MLTDAIEILLATHPFAFDQRELPRPNEYLNVFSQNTFGFFLVKNISHAEDFRKKIGSSAKFFLLSCFAKYTSGVLQTCNDVCWI